MLFAEQVSLQKEVSGRGVEAETQQCCVGHLGLLACAHPEPPLEEAVQLHVSSKFLKRMAGTA